MFQIDYKNQHEVEKQEKIKIYKSRKAAVL
jgi:hypothetical protein